jgi:hypothetical protein
MDFDLWSKISHTIADHNLGLDQFWNVSSNSDTVISHLLNQLFRVDADINCHRIFTEESINHKMKFLLHQD